jgi:hypothetical protein
MKQTMPIGTRVIRPDGTEVVATADDTTHPPERPDQTATIERIAATIPDPAPSRWARIGLGGQE